VITPEIEALFEAIRRRVARLGDRIADLSYANPYAGVKAEARATLRAALDDERLLDLQYSPFGGQTLARRATADALRKSHELPFAFRDVILTPGAMSALRATMRVAGAPGDEIVIPVPCWLDLPLFARSTGLVPRLVPLVPRTFDLDLDAIADAIGPGTCGIVLSHPANPTGRNYGPEALTALGAAIADAQGPAGRPLTLIADETHRDFTEPGGYRSAAGFFPRTLLVYSFGKYHFMQGQRLGYAATSPNHPERREVARELERWTRIDGVATPTSLMQRALPDLLRLTHDHGWIAAWRPRLVATVRSHGYTVTEPDATLFVYVETPQDYRDDFEFILALAERGLLALPAPLFHHEGWFRLSLTGSEPMLERALDVLGEVAPE
jgi:aspartate aminotransferase